MEVTEQMQIQARALADPSRFEILRFIAEADGPAHVAELTDLLGFNHNAIRQHLAVLTEAGLVVEADEKRTTRGRPRKYYRIRTDALSAFGSVSGSYQNLAELLLHITASNEDPYVVGYQAGISAPGPAEENVELAEAQRQLFIQLQVDGFEPASAADGSTELTNCPFAQVAIQNPAIVCELHRGLIHGFVASQHEDLAAALVTQTPNGGAACRVTMSRSGY